MRAGIDKAYIELRYYIKRKNRYELIIIDELTSEAKALSQLRHEINSGEVIADVSIYIYRQSVTGKKIYEDAYTLNPFVLWRVLRAGYR